MLMQSSFRSESLLRIDSHASRSVMLYCFELKAKTYQPAGGARVKLRISPKSVGFIL